MTQVFMGSYPCLVNYWLFIKAWKERDHCLQFCVPCWVQQMPMDICDHMCGIWILMTPTVSGIWSLSHQKNATTWKGLGGGSFVEYIWLSWRKCSTQCGFWGFKVQARPMLLSTLPCTAYGLNVKLLARSRELYTAYVFSCFLPW